MSFCSLIKGITPKIRMLCFVLTNSVLLNHLCVRIKRLILGSALVLMLVMLLLRSSGLVSCQTSPYKIDWPISISPSGPCLYELVNVGSSPSDGPFLQAIPSVFLEQHVDLDLHFILIPLPPPAPRKRGVGGGGWGGGRKEKVAHWLVTYITLKAFKNSREPVWPSGKALGW